MFIFVVLISMLMLQIVNTINYFDLTNDSEMLNLTTGNFGEVSVDGRLIINICVILGLLGTIIIWCILKKYIKIDIKGKLFSYKLCCVFSLVVCTVMTVISITALGFTAHDIIVRRDVQKTVACTRDILVHEKTIVYACGAVDINGETYSYTNSYEALEAGYQAGNRVFEIDFMRTGDDKLVCANDGAGVWAYGFDSEVPMTENEFLCSKFLGKLTPMGLDKLAEFMNDHEDIYVVTDVKDGNIFACESIVNKYPELVNRFVIQIYHIDEYEQIRNCGFENIIYTLYMTSDEERQPERLYNDVMTHDLWG